MEQAGKNTILLVRGTAAEPVGLSAFAAAQPDVQVQTVSGLDEARTALGRQHPTLIVMQSDEPGVQDLRRCAEMAAGAEAVFLLLVRQEAYSAVWRFLQKSGVCVMTWPMEPAIAAESAAAEKEHAGPNRSAAFTASGSQTHPEGERASHAAAWHDGAGRAPLD